MASTILCLALTQQRMVAMVRYKGNFHIRELIWENGPTGILAHFEIQCKMCASTCQSTCYGPTSWA